MFLADHTVALRCLPRSGKGDPVPALQSQRWECVVGTASPVWAFLRFRAGDTYMLSLHEDPVPVLPLTLAPSLNPPTPKKKRETGRIGLKFGSDSSSFLLESLGQCVCFLIF